MYLAKRLLIIFFICLIFIPFIGKYCYQGSTPNKFLTTENRIVTPYTRLESFHSHDLKKFFKNIDLYISDRLIKKDEIVQKINKYLTNPKYFLNFDISKGVKGTSGFLFLGNNWNKVIDRHFNKQYDFSDKSFQKLSGFHERLSKVVEKQGGKYFVFLGPDKHVVYCENFPNWLMNQSCDKATSVTNNIKDRMGALDINVVYPAKELTKEKEKIVYYKTDTHWNLLGAKIGFDSLIKEIINQSNLFKDSKFQENENFSLRKTSSDKIGDLGPIIGLGKNFKVDDVEYEIISPIKVLFSEEGGQPTEHGIPQILVKGGKPGWNAYMKNENAPNKLKVLIICDSFMIAMSRYFNLNFSDVHYLSRHTAMGEIEAQIKKIKPDLVVYETVERDFK